MQKHEFDVVIVGGGLVGATLACALAKSGLFKVAVIEKFALKNDGAVYTSSYDSRCSALSYGTSLAFKDIGCWQQIAEYARPIKSIHVSDKGHFGAARMSAEEENVEALGYVVENRWTGEVLVSCLHESENITLFGAATAVAAAIEKDSGSVTIEHEGVEKQLVGKIVVAADGNASWIKNYFNIETSNQAYGQVAIIANVTTEDKGDGMAYERFTDSGPMAMLPLVNDRYAMVWTAGEAQQEKMMSLPDDEFLKAVQERFGYRLGKLLKVGERATYPLALCEAREQVRHRLVVVGNAAHTLHPVAGQGFNLGVRDVVVLTNLLIQARRENRDIGELTLLKQYEQRRSEDQMHTLQFSDKLVKIFSTKIPAITLGRNLGLIAFDLMPPVKRMLAQEAMGLVCGASSLDYQT